MANAYYPKWKENLLQGTANNTLNGSVKAVLIDLAGYSYSAAHQFLSDIPAIDRIAISGALAGKTFTNGRFDADNATFTAVTGDVSEALALFIDTGNPATSPLIMYIDTGVPEFPITPNGGNINVTWNASGIFDL